MVLILRRASLFTSGNAQSFLNYFLAVCYGVRVTVFEFEGAELIGCIFLPIISNWWLYFLVMTDFS
jgi:hypothetical protein